MIVYLVSVGCDYEGEDVQTGFLSYNSAELYVKKWIEDYHKTVKNASWSKDISTNYHNRWRSGHDYIMIFEMEVSE